MNKVVILNVCTYIVYIKEVFLQVAAPLHDLVLCIYFKSNYFF